MGVYSQINLDEINGILEHYEIGKALSYSPTTLGISNSNYQVKLEGGQNVLLKVSNDKTIEQLTNEQNILLKLKKYNYEYSLHPFETIAGKPIYQHKGFYGVVFPFINGLPPEINSDTVFQIGRALGRLHSLEIRSEDLDTLRPYDLVGYGGQSIVEYTQSQKAAGDFVTAFQQIFPDKLQGIPYDLFPCGIIHGDLYFDNSLFYEEKLVTLIDFEQSGTGRFILDVGIAISGTCLNDSNKKVDPKLIQAFLSGYEEARKLLTIEKEYLDTAIIVGFFSIGLWRIKRFYEGNLDERKKYNYRELLERARIYHTNPLAGKLFKA